MGTMLVLFSFIFLLFSDINCDVLSEVVCERSEDGYLIPDPYQCDRYAECSPGGKLTIQLCADGNALDLNTGNCDLFVKIDCQGREKLQPPTGTGLCPRPNGNFPVPVEVSCAEYVDCREGQAFMQSCGHGAVFDEQYGCVHPDETSRIGCRAEDVFGFKCPDLGDEKRFGDHERLPHPEDCAFFYACLSTGQPRLLGCEKPKVFEPESGLCKKQSLVPGCENRYPIEDDEGNQVDLKEERDRIAAEIKAELELKFGLKRGSLSSDTVSADSPDNNISARSSQQSSRGQQTARAGQSVSADAGVDVYDDEPDAFASLGRGRTVKAQSRINTALNEQLGATLAALKKEAAEDNGFISGEDVRQAKRGKNDPVSRRNNLFSRYHPRK